MMSWQHVTACAPGWAGRVALRHACMCRSPSASFQSSIGSSSWIRPGNVLGKPPDVSGLSLMQPEVRRAAAMQDVSTSFRSNFSAVGTELRSGSQPLLPHCGLCCQRRQGRAGACLHILPVSDAWTMCRAACIRSLVSPDSYRAQDAR